MVLITMKVLQSGNVSKSMSVVTVNRWVFSEPKIPYESLPCADLGNFPCAALPKSVTVHIPVNCNCLSTLFSVDFTYVSIVLELQFIWMFNKRINCNDYYTEIM